MVHTLTDPHMITLTYVGEIRVGQAVEITRVADGSAALTMKRFSTLLVERVG
mgnify:CR=1 FL=1